MHKGGFRGLDVGLSLLSLITEIALKRIKLTRRMLSNS